jgi:hypothetical protein
MMLKSHLLMATVLAALSAVPAWAVPAQDRENHGQRQEEPRMYDSVHRDYHNWNADEDRRYREYLNEHHQKYREFSRLKKKQQNEYWQWRHDHDDHR